MDSVTPAELTLALMFAGQLVVVALGAGALMERVKNLKEKLAGLDGTPASVAELKARVDGLEEDRALAKDLLATLSGLAEKVSGLGERFTSLERKVEQLAKRSA